MKNRVRVAWVLIDLSNSNPRSNNYLWWFETRELAREHRREQHAIRANARLSQPQKWLRID